MPDVGKIPDRVARKMLDRLGLKFTSETLIVNEIRKRIAMGETTDRVAEEMVDNIILTSPSRDEVRGIIETLAFVVRDHMTGGN